MKIRVFAALVLLLALLVSVLYFAIASVSQSAIGSTSVSTSVQASYPVLVWDQEPGNYSGQIFPLEFTAFSDRPGVQVSVILDNQTLQIWNDDYFVNFGYNLSLSAFPSGNHTLTLRLVDALGRTAELVHPFILDSKAPIMQVSLPKYEFNYNESIVLTWNITDENFDRVEVYLDLDETPRVTLETSIGSLLLKSSQMYMSDGVHYVRIIGYDSAGNYVEVTLTFSVHVPADRIPQYGEADLQRAIADYQAKLDQVPKQFAVGFFAAGLLAILFGVIGAIVGRQYGISIVKKLRIAKVLRR